VGLRRYLGQVSKHLDDSFSISERCVLSAENRRSLKIRCGHFGAYLDRSSLSIGELLTTIALEVVTVSNKRNSATAYGLTP
jgi:hypothetical protein